MSIHEISSRLLRAGIGNMIVTSSEDSNASRLVVIKAQLMVKAVGDTDIAKATRLAEDVKALISAMEKSTQYRSDALKAASDLSRYVKLYGSLLRDPKFAKYEKVLVDYKTHFSRATVPAIYSSLADVVLALSKHYSSGSL